MMKTTILTLTLLLLSGCVYETVEQQRIARENEYNSLLTELNDLNTQYDTLIKESKAYKPIECPTCKVCSNISGSCLNYIQTIKRLEKERSWVFQQNDTIYCNELKENLSRCEKDLNITEEN